MTEEWNRNGSNDPLDELLGLDPTPELSEAARVRIRERLARADGRALDALLELDEVEVPDGLSARVLASCRTAEQDEAGAVSRPRSLVRRLSFALPAAAAVLLAVRIWSPFDRAPRPLDPEPSAELLAVLPTLEEMAFLTEELDPLEADALFLFEDDEDVLLELALDAGMLEENG